MAKLETSGAVCLELSVLFVVDCVQVYCAMSMLLQHGHIHALQAFITDIIIIIIIIVTY